LRTYLPTVFKRIASVIAEIEFVPWRLPGVQQLTELEDLLAPPNPEARIRAVPPMNAQRFYVSAASQAICFLDSLQSYQRSNLRHIVIHEDKKSVALPQYHLYGLVPYLEELKRLHIERNINLWNPVHVKSS
jgi:hypothetical protein